MDLKATTCPSCGIVLNVSPKIEVSPETRAKNKTIEWCGSIAAIVIGIWMFANDTQGAPMILVAGIGLLVKLLFWG